MAITSQREFIMTLHIKQIINSDLALKSTQGTLLYLAMLNTTTKTITLNFEGLRDCGVLFIDASIAKYLRGQKTKEIRYKNCMCIWKGKIDKAVGAKLNDTANANLQRLINS